MAYSPTLGRWMQGDPSGYTDGLNLQEYVGSNPVKYVDPTGLEIWVDSIPKPHTTRPDPDKEKKKPDGKGDKKTDWPIWWSRVYGNTICLRTYTQDTTSVEDMVKQMRDTVGDPSKPEKRISRWVIRSHGNSTGIFVGDGSGGTQAIDPYNIHLLKPLQGYFSADARLTIWACDVGQNQKMMQDIADLLQIEVVGYTSATDDAFNPLGTGKWVTVKPRPPTPPATQPVTPQPGK